MVSKNKNGSSTEQIGELFFVCFVKFWHLIWLSDNALFLWFPGKEINVPKVMGMLQVISAINTKSDCRLYIHEYAIEVFFLELD